MPAVFHLADVFQKVIHTLYYRPFPQQQLIIHVHQYILNIPAQTGNQLDTLTPQVFKQRLRNITTVSEELSPQVTAQPVDNIPIPIVNIARS
jgi:ribulose-5-phosphate 4-epimerase/fuculose-1-phosphate aldolase